MPRHTKRFHRESDFFESLTSAELSPTTKRIYMERWRFMVETLKTDVFSILTHPKKYIPWIMEYSSELATRKSYLSAVLAMFRHNEGLKEQEKTHYLAWYDAFRQIHEEIDARYKRNQPSAKQVDGYVPFADIVAKRDELDKGTPERLLLAFYTYIPPLRSDLNRIRIYDKQAPSHADDNYIQLDTPARKATLTLREFKTAARMEKYEKELPRELVDEIVASLDRDPRSYLFEDRNRQPYRSSSFTKWANRTLHRLFGKGLTISLIRHSYINSLDFNTLTVEEKEKIAKDMAHTVGTQDRYRLIF